MLPLLFLYGSLINDVRSLIGAHNLPAAEQKVRTAGATPEAAAALSWLARAELADKHYSRADQFAAETRQMADSLLRTRKLDADPYLPTAVGAAIEVHAQALAAQGQRAEAIPYLRQQLKLFAGTSLTERIRKNINLLGIEGKPAPPLEETAWLGPQPSALASLRGRAVLLFFWAHWCVDCKGEVKTLADLQRKFGPRLAIIGPTKLYGYVAGGNDAPPALEKPYIDQVRREFYAVLSGMPVPLGAANFLTYGASTTPTLVLIDPAGIVRYYHPGAASEADLSAHIDAVLKK
jgi:thiol-disulfide isomerase/thioredoxin